jgi:hypothetical protein
MGSRVTASRVFHDRAIKRGVGRGVTEGETLNGAAAAAHRAVGWRVHDESPGGVTCVRVRQWLWRPVGRLHGRSVTGDR